MKIAQYNDMMAHLTRRQKFSNGGDAILPQPNPLSPQERNQKVFNDYVGRMKHYLTGADMPKWFVKDLIFKKADELGIELKASGGRIGRRFGSPKPKTNVQKIKETFEPKNKNLKPVDPKKQKGLSKLPRQVRNKMGYMKKGGRV